VTLSEEDEKKIFDLSVHLLYGDLNTVQSTCMYLKNGAFFDFPPEVFLQRTDILHALLQLLEGTQGSKQ
jgi:hypothetical protein